MTDAPKKRRNTVKPDMPVAEAPAPVAPAVPKAPAPVPTRVKTGMIFKRRMSQGDHGPAVAEIQRLLVDQGFFDGRADGRYGIMLSKAVRMFQGSKGIHPNGEVDLNTWKALTA